MKLKKVNITLKIDETKKGEHNPKNDQTSRAGSATLKIKLSQMYGPIKISIRIFKKKCIVSNRT